MKPQLNEAFKVSKTKDERGNIIAIIDPSKPENKESFKFKDVFKNHGAKWSGKFWYWYVGKTEDQWRNVFSKFIEPALKQVHGSEGASEVEGKEAIIASLDALIGEIQANPISSNSEISITPQKEAEIKSKLSNFKNMLVNIDNDEDFKNAMSSIIKFKNAQGYKFSFGNAILIYIQNSKATIVNNKSNWEKIYNRTISPNAEPLMVYAPNTGSGGRPKEDKDTIAKEFLKKINKQDVNQLTPNEKIKLQTQQRGFTYATSFKFVPVYDVKDTVQMEGKEDHIKGIGDYENLKWHEENNLSEEVRPIYSALLKFAESKGIEIQHSDDLGGARGNSGSGKVSILKNEGNDIGLTKTLAHEITHELLHQKYLSSKDNELSRFFIGREGGRDAIEQQAEISAWMFMYAFGYDLKTTSLNYTLIWGGDKDNMIKVFDTVSSVVNYLIDFVNEQLKLQAGSNGNVSEENDNANQQFGKHINTIDIINKLGLQSDYKEVVGKEKMMESFYRLSGNKKIL